MATREFDRKGRKRIRCMECGEFFHALAPHLKKRHDMSVEEYLGKNTVDGEPPPPTISTYASEEIDASRKRKKKRERPAPQPDTAVAGPSDADFAEKPLDALVIEGWEIPIRDPECIPEQARQHVPPHDENYEPDNDLLGRVAQAVELDEVLMLTGPTGSGKTSLCYTVGALMNMPCVRIQCDGETSYGKLFGKTQVRVDSESGKQVTVFEQGLIPVAGRSGAFIIVDEADALSPDVRIALHECLEKDALGRRKCTLETGAEGDLAEVVWFHPMTRFFLTGNNLGSDLDGLYGGTDSAPNLAFLDRCERVNVGYPSQKIVAKIVEAKSGGLAPATCKLIAKAVHEVLQAHVTASLPWVLSLRRAVVLGTKMRLYEERGIDAKKAVQVAVLDNVPVDDVRNDVRGILQRVGLPTPKAV